MTSLALLLLTTLVQAPASPPPAPPGRPSFGWVFDEAKQPVLGARAQVFGEPGEAKPLAAAVSAQFGRFQLPDLAPGRYVLRLDAAGYSTHVERIEIPAGNGPFELGRFLLERMVTLEGRVTLESGEPVAGAQIWMNARGPAGARRQARLRATSDGDGGFRIPGLDRNLPVALEVCRQGFQSASVTVPDPASVLQVTLAPGARIEGRVLNRQGQPLAGAQVTTDPRPADPPCGEQLGTAKSEADGRFLFDGLRPGTYDLFAAAEGYIGAEVERVQARGGERATIVQILLERGALLTGTVLGDDGKPVAGAALEALGEHAQPKAQSDTAGRFILRGVEPVQQPVRVSHPDYRPSETTVRVAEGDNERDFVLTRLARLGISGRVLAPDGSAAPGARVVLAGKPVATADAEGSFSLVQANGTYELTAFKAGFAPGITRPPVVIDGRAVSGVVIRLGKSASVTGRLLGLPAGARVQVTAESPPFSLPGTVGRDGTYRVADLGAGDWAITAKAGDRTTQGTVRLGKDDSAKTLDLTFAPRFEVSGWVLAPSGEPVAGADVLFFPVSTGGEGVPARSGRDGSFRVELEPGRYNVLCQRPGYSPGRLPDPLWVASGPVSKLELRLEPGLAIHVTFRGLDKHTQPEEIWAEAADGRHQPGVISPGAGAWIPRLPPGEYTVKARRWGRLVEAPVRVDAAQGEARVELEFFLGNEGLFGRLAKPPEGTVFVELLAGRSMIARVKVSDSGHFSVHQLEPGRYRLRIRREDDKEVLFEQDVAVPTHYMLILGLKEPGAGGLP